MKRLVIFTLLTLTLLTGLISCKKPTSNSVFSNGTYHGTFQRQSSGKGEISNVTIVFNDNKWVGQSDKIGYPALCEGSFKTSGINKISFSNSCAWTSDFDWSLILNNEYTVQVIGNKYIMTQNFDNMIENIYILTKQ
jgi:hypothetical protein